MADFGLRKMAGGSGGDRFRTATPLSVRPGLKRGVAPVHTCPTYAGQVPDVAERPMELSTDGSQIFIIAGDLGSGDTVESFAFPALTANTGWSLSGVDAISSLAVDPSGNLAICAHVGSDYLIKNTAGSTIFTPPSGRAETFIRRRCDDPTKAIVMSSVNSGTRLVRLYEIDIATGSSTQVFPGSGDHDLGLSVYSVHAPVTTPDGAVWFNGLIDPGGVGTDGVWRWTSGGGITRVPNVGEPDDGPANGLLGLVARPDSSVAAHFTDNSFGTPTEYGMTIKPDLSLEANACLDELTDGPNPPFAGPLSVIRMVYSCNTPDCSLAVFTPAASSYDRIWRWDS